MGFVNATGHGAGRSGIRKGVGDVVLLAVALVAVVLLAAGACGDVMAEARALEDRGDLEGAVVLYEQILEEQPDDLSALSAAAVDLLLLGLFDEALPLQERVRALDPDEIQIRIELAFNYLNHQGRAGDAVRVFEEAVALEPGAKHMTYLAQALMEAGNTAESERSLREAIEMDAGYGHSYSVLVRLLRAQGRAEEAAVIVEQASLHGITVTEPR